MTIREGTAHDLDALVTMGTEFIRTTSYRAIVPENAAQMAELATRLVNGPESTVLVSEVDGVLTGMIGLVAYGHYISGERVCGEVFLFVTAAARGRTGLALIRHAEQWARDQHAVRLELIAPSDRTGDLYSRLGYVPVERTYHRSLCATD